VARRSRIGAGALWAHVEKTTLVHPRDAAAPGADGVYVEHRETHGKAVKIALPRDERLTVLDETDVGAGAADVEGDDVTDSDGDREARGARHAGGRAGDERAHGVVARLAGRRDAAVRLQDLRRRKAHRAGALFQVLEIAAHHGAERRIERGRADALVFAKLGEHLVRGAGERLGKALAHRLRDQRLVRRPHVAVQEAHRDGLDALALEVGEYRVERRRVRRNRRIRRQVHALAQLAPQVTRHGRRRLVEADVVVVRLALAPDLEDVAKALGGDESRARSAPGDDGVGRDGRAVPEVL